MYAPVMILFILAAQAIASPADFLADVRWAVEFAGIIVAGILLIKKTITDSEALDLHKTLEAAADAASRVNDHIAVMPTNLRERLLDGVEGVREEHLDPLVERAVAHVEEIRGKRLSPKLIRKARERILSHVKAPTPNDPE